MLIVAARFRYGVRAAPRMLWLEEGGRDGSLGIGKTGPRFLLTLILSTEDKDPMAGQDLELVVLGGASHLDDGQWDHPLGVRLLE